VGVRPGHESVFGVWDIYLHQERTGGHVDGMRGTRHATLKALSGQLGQFDADPHAVLDPLTVFFRDRSEDTHGAGLGDPEQLGARTAVAGVDEVAGIRTALG